MLLLFIVSAATLAYVYCGYSLLLWLLVRMRSPRAIRRADITPSLSLVISAYNEAHVIRRKIENALALSYPRKALEIVVVSDASDDGTDEIVAEYAGRGVKLARQTERRGKTAGLNRTVPTLAGDIVVFSDANAMYEPSALARLARNFADPGVGCVTGEARYLTGDNTAADVGERVYWGYEMHIKRLETALGSMVGGDGAIYAIRQSLWRTLPENAINDFLNPLQIVAAGWRAVYEPEAVCYEETAGAMRMEFRRRVRIVSRSWRAVFQAEHVLNPFRVGLFAWSLFSHKVLRWLSGLFALLAIVGALGIARPAIELSPGAALAFLALVALFAAGSRLGRRTVIMLPYFAVINAASLVGVTKGTFGSVSGIWSTPREAARSLPRTHVNVPVGPLFLLSTPAIAALALSGLAHSHHATAIVFWASTATLAYIFAGYPLLLALLRATLRLQVRHSSELPSVCLFIAANDEASVIEAKLQNALALDYPGDRLDVVVASDGSVDATNDIVRRFGPRVRLIELSPRRGKVAAITEGMRSVTSDVVIFSDANTFLEPGAARALVRNFGDPGVGGVSGDVALEGERAALGSSEDLYYRYERWIQRAESEIGSMIGVDGALYAIRRHLFEPPASDTILDDMAIPMSIVRAGYRVVFEPGARAHEQGSESAREEFARKSRVIAGAVQFLRRPDSDVPVNRIQVMLSLLSHKGLRWLTPCFATTAFLASVSLASSSGAFATAAVAQLVLLTFGFAGCSMTLRRSSVIAVAHYLCLVQAAAAVGFLRGLSGRQTVLWQRFGRVTAEHHVSLEVSSWTR